MTWLLTETFGRRHISREDKVCEASILAAANLSANPLSSYLLEFIHRRYGSDISDFPFTVHASSLRSSETDFRSIDVPIHTVVLITFQPKALAGHHINLGFFAVNVTRFSSQFIWHISHQSHTILTVL